MTSACPCGSGFDYARCCQPLHLGESQAVTAEQLMRARYSAYAVADLDFVWRTWHPNTRPDSLHPDVDLGWTRLEILGTAAGGVGDDAGEVEFRAYYLQNRRSGRSAPAVAGGTLHERSRFAVRARRWLYVDGEILD